MKRNIMIAVALMATLTLTAQNIAVVSSSNATKMYRTLDTAIKGAEDGSIIYLPGGGWVINDTTVIDKRLTIMGVSHRGDTDNTDGATIIGGNLNFVKGSDGSAVMGCYISGNVNIATSGVVNNILIRYCNLLRIRVNNSDCQGVTINQNYIREPSYFGGSNVKITNNIMKFIHNVNGGIISNNLITGNHYIANSTYCFMVEVSNSIVNGNVFLTDYYEAYKCSNTEFYDNLKFKKGQLDAETNTIISEDVDWNDVFVKYNKGAISTVSNFHFKGDYKKYESMAGIYAGSGFSDNKSLAPIPRIVSKTVDEQTDGSGRLLINVTVKAQ